MGGVDEIGGRCEEEAVPLDVDGGEANKFILRLQVELDGDLTGDLEIPHPPSLAMASGVGVGMNIGVSFYFVGFNTSTTIPIFKHDASFFFVFFFIYNFVGKFHFGTRIFIIHHIISYIIFTT